MGTLSVKITANQTLIEKAGRERLDAVAMDAETAFARVGDLEVTGVRVETTIGVWLVCGRYLPTATVKISGSHCQPGLFCLREHTIGDVEFLESKGPPIGMRLACWRTAFEILCPRL